MLRRASWATPLVPGSGGREAAPEHVGLESASFNLTCSSRILKLSPHLPEEYTAWLLSGTVGARLGEGLIFANPGSSSRLGLTVNLVRFAVRPIPSKDDQMWRTLPFILLLLAESGVGGSNLPHLGGETANTSILYDWAKPSTIMVSQRMPAPGTTDARTCLERGGVRVRRTWQLRGSPFSMAFGSDPRRRVPVLSESAPSATRWQLGAIACALVAIVDSGRNQERGSLLGLSVLSCPDPDSADGFSCGCQ